MGNKQFLNNEEFHSWMRERYDKEAMEDPIKMLTKGWEQEVQEIISELKEQGYDLDNLLADGHAYELGGHTGGTWIWEDEADLSYIESSGSTREIRKREV